MAQIIAPEPHNNFMNGVQFVNGQAESSKASTLDYFTKIGYRVISEQTYGSDDGEQPGNPDTSGYSQED